MCRFVSRSAHPGPRKETGSPAKSIKSYCDSCTRTSSLNFRAFFIFIPKALSLQRHYVLQWVWFGLWEDRHRGYSMLQLPRLQDLSTTRIPAHELSLAQTTSVIFDLETTDVSSNCALGATRQQQCVVMNPAVCSCIMFSQTSKFLTVPLRWLACQRPSALGIKYCWRTARKWKKTLFH